MTIGACFVGFGKKKKNANKEITLAIFGIDNAGKTTTTKSIRGESLEVCPTMGFDLIEFSLDSYNVSMYDIGGSNNLRSIWNNYFSEIHGLVYVVDSCDSDRLDETRSTLAGLLQNELIQGKPVLLLANKQDSNEAMDEAELVSSLRLSELACANRCPCRLERSVANIGTGAKMDKGIKIGLRWLLQYISLNWEELNTRVQRDKADKAAADAEEAAARKERVRRRREERERQEAAEAAAAAAACNAGATEGDQQLDAAAAGKDEDVETDETDHRRRKQRGAKLREVEPLNPSSSTVDEDTKSSPSLSRRNRRHRRTSGDENKSVVDEVVEQPDDVKDDQDDDADSTERRRRSRQSHHQHLRRRRRSSSLADDDAGEAAVDNDVVEEASRDRSDRKQKSSKSSSKTGRRHRRLAPAPTTEDGDGDIGTAATATPTGLFEIGRKGRGDGAGSSSGRLSKLPPLRGAQPNTDEVDHLT